MTFSWLQSSEESGELSVTLHISVVSVERTGRGCLKVS